MPIIDIEPVGEATIDTAQLAAALGDALKAPAGTLWIRVRRLDKAAYAENGGLPARLPVFVRVLARHGDSTLRQAQALAIAEVVAQTVARPRASVHVIFEPGARGRVFFGGEPDRR